MVNIVLNVLLVISGIALITAGVLFVKLMLDIKKEDSPAIAGGNSDNEKTTLKQSEYVFIEKESAELTVSSFHISSVYVNDPDYTFLGLL